MATTNDNADAQAQPQSRHHSLSDSESYFNDLSQQTTATSGPNEQQPKSKRMACVLCRKRKLRCDGARPACATCARLSHDCVYDEVRKKSGPKRGYVKALEARLAQVETMLKTQEPSPVTEESSTDLSDGNITPGNVTTNPLPGHPDMDITYMDDFANFDPGLSGLVHDAAGELGSIMTNLRSNPDMLKDADRPIRPTAPGEGYMPIPMQTMQDSWGALIGLDIEEPLPSPEIVAELNQVYFETCHSTLPLIHRPRFLMSMSHTSPKLRPPVALQYIVWAFAASVTDKYATFHRHYYERARYYFERDEMKGQGEGIISVLHVQALVLICSYEFKSLMFPRAWMSSGRAARLALMLGLHRVDGDAMDVKQCLPPPKDWIEREERRRTLWMCFSTDRYASIGTGWPMVIDEADLKTHLPSSEEAYDRGIIEPSFTLEQALQPGGASRLSPFAAVVVLACLFGRNLLHLHRPTSNEDEVNLSGEFWRRHRSLDSIILNISLGLPENLRLPLALSNPNSIFMNMCLHTSTICLHQAAIFKADKHRQLAKVSSESKVRCITAAAEIANIMKLSSHQDMAAFNPFTCFCLYVSARVFVQYLKSRPREDHIRSSLFFMLAAMHAMKKKNPLAESFLVQLDVDLEAAGLEDMRSFSSDIVDAPGATRGECNVHQILPGLGEGSQVLGERVTYGDNGLAMHTSPALHPSCEADISSSQDVSNPDSQYNRSQRPPNSTFSFSSSNMPVRQRNESAVQSPQTLSPDNMEFSGSSNSPNSVLNGSSGRVSSITSVSPPSINQDDPMQSRSQERQPRLNLKNYGILPGAGFNMRPPPEEDMVYNENEHFSSHYNSNNNDNNNNNTSYNFSSTSNGGVTFDFSQYTTEGVDLTQQKTGMTPVGVTDLGSMTDAEFNAMMSGVVGWDGDGMDQVGEAHIYRLHQGN